MKSIAFQAFRLVLSAMLATGLGMASAQAQNTTTTIQEGRVCINRTFQSGDSNDNATYQSCKVNINRTTQVGGNNMIQTGQFGRVNHNRTSQLRGFKHTGYKHARSNQSKYERHRSKRGRDYGRGTSYHDD
jgi:predicted DNA-binding WGR domain protein